MVWAFTILIFLFAFIFPFSCNIGLTGSVVLRSGRLSDLIFQLQELLQGVSEVEISPQKYDTALLAAQVMHISFFFF